jgi:hypothetical protein
MAWNRPERVARRRDLAPALIGKHGPPRRRLRRGRSASIRSPARGQKQEKSPYHATSEWSLVDLAGMGTTAVVAHLPSEEPARS